MVVKYIIFYWTSGVPPQWAPPKRTSSGVAAHPNWGPAKAQRSGFGGERRSKEVNGAFRPKGGNGVHGLCDDEVENQWKRTLSRS